MQVTDNVLGYREWVNFCVPIFVGLRSVPHIIWQWRGNFAVPTGRHSDQSGRDGQRPGRCGAVCRTPKDPTNLRSRRQRPDAAGYRRDWAAIVDRPGQRRKQRVSRLQLKPVRAFVVCLPPPPGRRNPIAGKTDPSPGTAKRHRARPGPVWVVRGVQHDSELSRDIWRSIWASADRDRPRRQRSGTADGRVVVSEQRASCRRPAEWSRQALPAAADSRNHRSRNL